MMQAFTPSQSRGIFLIKYRIDIFIKHRSKTEFGKGNFISFPVIIKQPPCSLPGLKDYQD
jgi:hypothetical protein